MNEQEKINIIEEAFSCHAGHSCLQCNCGKVFYNSNGGWDWEEGELEKLISSDAINLDYSVESMGFEGKIFCKDCNCWHKRALAIFGFLLSHNLSIIDFFELVKKQKLKEADNIRTIPKT